jgi:DNA-binding PadR family transcriptional regulator
MYELIILSLLMRFPLHGYLIAKITNDTIGPWAKVSNGTLYPLLGKLEHAGLIARVNDEGGEGKGEQQARTFMITDAGRERFYQIMGDTTSNIGDYQRMFHLKVAYMDLVPVRERRYLLNHYIHYCEASILHIKTEAEDLKHELVGNHEREAFKGLALKTMQHRADMWQAEMDWTMQLREELSS